MRTTTRTGLTLSLGSLFLTACGGGGGGDGTPAGGVPGPPGSLGAMTSAGMLASLDDATGAMSLIEDLGPSGLRGVTSLAIDATANRLYAVDNDRGLLLRSSFTGDLTFLAQPESVPHSVAFEPATGDLFGLRYGGPGTDELFRLDATTGEVTVVGPTARLAAFCYDPGADRLWGVTSGRDLVLVDPANGAYSTVYNDLDLYSVTGLAWDPVAGQLLGVRNGDDGELIAINTVVPGVTDLDVVDEPLVDLAVDADSGRRFAVTEAGELVELGVPAGALKSVRVLERSLQGLTRDASDGRYFASDLQRGALVKLDPATGTCELLGPIRVPGGPAVEVRTLAYDSLLQRLYAIDEVSRNLLTLDPTDGTATLHPGWLFYPDTFLALDPQTGALHAYEKERNLSFLVDPTVPSADITGSQVLGSSSQTFFVEDLTFDTSTGRLVAAGFIQTDLGGGSSAFEDAIFGFTPGQPFSQVLLAQDLAFDPQAIGYDPVLARFDLFATGQPLFSYEPQVLGPDYRTERGPWRRSYTATLKLPAEDAIFAVDASSVWRLEASASGSTAKLGSIAGGAGAQDVLYDASAGWLGFRKGTQITWASPSMPWATKDTTSLVSDYDAVVGDPDAPTVFYGIKNGSLFLEDTAAGSSTGVTQAPLLGLVVEAAVLRPHLGRIDVISSDRELWRIDVASGAWTLVGEVTFGVQGLYVN